MGFDNDLMGLYSDFICTFNSDLIRFYGELVGFDDLIVIVWDFIVM